MEYTFAEIKDRQNKGRDEGRQSVLSAGRVMGNQALLSCLGGNRPMIQRCPEEKLQEIRDRGEEDKDIREDLLEKISYNEERNGGEKRTSDEIKEELPKLEGEELIKRLAEEEMKISRRKGERLGLMSQPEKTEFPEGSEGQKYYYDYYNMEKEGEKGPFHVEFEGGKVMWRGDDRPPDTVKKTGFTSKMIRDAADKGVADFKNTIIFRADTNDDILPESGVCVSEKLGGACFFPLDKKPDTIYLYAIKISEAVSTMAAQTKLDRIERNVPDPEDPEEALEDWKISERFQYDPNYEHMDTMSAVWLYGEYVVHRIPVADILAVVEVHRVLKDQEDGKKDLDASRGIKLEFGDVTILASSDKDGEIEAEVARYKDKYPKSGKKYLTYQGSVDFTMDGPVQSPVFGDPVLFPKPSPAEKEPSKKKSQEEKPAKEETPEKEAPEEEAPKEETPEKEAPEEEAPEEETPEKEAPKEEAPEKEAPEKEAPEEETPEKEAPKKEVPEKEAPEEKSSEEKSQKKKPLKALPS